MPLRATYRFFLIIICFVYSLSAYGQEFRQFSDVTADGTSYHIFAKEGEATVQVMLLGAIGSPGIYVISTKIELDELIALAGGTPLTSSATEDITITIRLFHEGNGRRELAYEARAEEMLREPGLMPPLQDGDVITIESYTKERRRIDALQIFSILSSVASLLLVFSNIRN